MRFWGDSDGALGWFLDVLGGSQEVLGPLGKVYWGDFGVI